MDAAAVGFSDGGVEGQAGQAGEASMPGADSCSAGPCEVLASGRMDPYAIAVDATHIYWTEPSAVVSMPIHGGAVSTLATAPDPRAIAVDSARVYWADFGENVSSVPLRGGNVSTLATGQLAVRGVAAGGGSVFWTTNVTQTESTGTLVSATPDGGLPSILVAQLFGPSAPVSDDTFVYWATSGSDGSGLGPSLIARVSVGGGAVQTLVSGQSQSALVAVDETRVFWFDGVSGMPVAPASLRSMSKVGGTPTTLATDSGGPLVMASDGTSVYWTATVGANGTVLKKVGVSGGTVTTLVSAADIGGFAVDATSVYWTNHSGSGFIARTPK